MNSNFNVKLTLDSIEYSKSGANVGNDWEISVKYTSKAPKPIIINESDYNGTKTFTEKIGYGETVKLGLTIIDAPATSPYSDAFWPIYLSLHAVEKDLVKDDHGMGDGSIIAVLDQKKFENSTSVEIVVQEEVIGGSRGRGVLIAHFTLVSTPTSDEEFEGDRFLSIYYNLVSKAWKDPSLKEKLLADPAGMLASNGVDVPPGVAVKIVEDTDNVKYLNLAREIDVDTNAYGLGLLVKKILPIKEGQEIRLIQSSAKTRYLIFPNLPDNVSTKPNAESRISFTADSSGVEATFHDTTALTEVEQTEVTVTTTSVVQDAEAATTAAGVAEVVAVAAAVLT